MATYFGVDFHARQQTISYCDTADGVIHLKELDHARDDLQGFYSQFAGEVIVGIEGERLQHLVCRATGGLRASGDDRRCGRD